ncbi:MAG: hypothetical protein LC733_13195, partial [Actinobacteria bacterium]|nr:hypothetical protein [Actinomycetota bacterium]
MSFWTTCTGPTSPPCSYRDTEIAREHPLTGLLADLRRDQEVVRLRVEGLDENEVRALVEAAEEHDLDREAGIPLARALHSQTNGNPFFVAEVLRHLAETGAVYQRDGRWTYDLAAEDLAIPDEVRQAVDARLSRLPKQAADVLAAASVVGREFDLAVLEGMFAPLTNPDDVLDHVEEALAARLLIELPDAHARYSFTHDLVRHALYDGLVGARRARLHRRAGLAIEALRGGDTAHQAALAHHFAEARSEELAANAAEYALSAARQALDQLSFEEAAARLERGVAALGDDVRRHPRLRVALLLALAQTRGQLMDHPGRREASLRAAEAARVLGSADALAWAACWYNARAIAGLRDDTGISLCHEALAALGDSQPGLRALVQGILAAHLAFAGAVDEAAPLSGEALEGARASGNPEALVMALFARYYALWGSPHVDERLSLAEELLGSTAVALAGWVSATDGYRFRAVARLAAGDLAGCVADVATLQHYGREMRNRYFEAVAAHWQGLRLLLEGRFDEVEASAAELLRLGADDSNLRNMFGAQMWYLRHEQGRLHEFKPLLLAILDANPGLPGLRSALAVTWAELGEAEQAHSLLREVAADDFASIPTDLVWLAAMAAFSEACAVLE